MTFKLDPGAWLEASQKAKAWQQQPLGVASPMSFSSGLVGKKETAPYWMDEQPKIITPEIGVFSNDATDTILGGHIDAYSGQAELGMQALGLRGDVARAERQYEFAKELAEKRKKARKKKGGIGGFLSGALSGASVGSSFGPVGAGVGALIGGASSFFG